MQNNYGKLGTVVASIGLSIFSLATRSTDFGSQQAIAGKSNNIVKSPRRHIKVSAEPVPATN